MLRGQSAVGQHCLVVAGLAQGSCTLSKGPRTANRLEDRVLVGVLRPAGVLLGLLYATDHRLRQSRLGAHRRSGSRRGRVLDTALREAIARDVVRASILARHNAAVQLVQELLVLLGLRWFHRLLH